MFLLSNFIKSTFFIPANAPKDFVIYYNSQNTDKQAYLEWKDPSGVYMEGGQKYVNGLPLYEYRIYETNENGFSMFQLKITCTY